MVTPITVRPEQGATSTSTDLTLEVLYLCCTSQLVPNITVSRERVACQAPLTGAFFTLTPWKDLTGAADATCQRLQPDNPHHITRRSPGASPCASTMSRKNAILFAALSLVLNHSRRNHQRGSCYRTTGVRSLRSAPPESVPHGEQRKCVCKRSSTHTASSSQAHDQSLFLPRDSVPKESSSPAW